MRTSIAFIALLTLLAACATESPTERPPTADALQPQRAYYAFASRLPPHMGYTHEAVWLDLANGRRIVERQYRTIDWYAPDISVVALADFGPHGEGADSSSLLVHLRSGVSLEVSGVVGSTPEPNLLMINGGGMLYEGGSLGLARVTDAGHFEEVFHSYFAYVFAPQWRSAQCVEIEEYSSEHYGVPREHVSQINNGSWQVGDGACPA